MKLVPTFFNKNWLNAKGRKENFKQGGMGNKFARN